MALAIAKSGWIRQLARKAACIRPNHQQKGKMMNIKKLLVISALFLCGTAFAAAEPEDDGTLFYCRFRNGKQVHIQQHGDNIRYRFGKNLSRPELSFEQPKTEVFGNSLTPLMDNNQRADIIEIYMRHNDTQYTASSTTTRKSVYRLSVEHAGKTRSMTCNTDKAFIHPPLVANLPQIGQ